MAWRTKVVDHVVRVNGRIVTHRRACPSVYGGRGGARRYHAFVIQKRVLLIRKRRISLVKALLKLADAPSQTLNLRRMLLFDVGWD